MKPNANTAAICGLFCGTCPSFPNECEGCLSDKTANDCTFCFNGFRTCAKEHNVIRCYECSKFPCEKLNDFSTKHVVNGIGHHKTVVADLLSMKEDGVDAWVEKKTQENTCQKCGELIYWFDTNSHKCN